MGGRVYVYVMAGIKGRDVGGFRVTSHQPMSFLMIVVIFLSFSVLSGNVRDF